MKEKRGMIFGMIFLIGVFLISFASSQTEPSYCCEKWLAPGGNPVGSTTCVDAPKSQCDTSGGLRAVPTSCEATDYCRRGTCIDEAEGDCSENFRRTCEENDGIWKEQSAEELPQCQLGCCLIGSQAAFVTPTRCSHLSRLYGLEINFRKDIQNEFECIASATEDIEGACVLDREFGRTCKRLTRKECNEMETTEGAGDVSFHEGYLCSNEELNADCGPSDRTTCVDGKDEVYFLDTCGNLANVFDSSKAWDTRGTNPDVENYWNYIAGTHEVTVDCVVGTGGGIERNCGNCDYYEGNTCKKGERGEPEYFCKDLGCEDDWFSDTYDRQPEHGETWCEYYEPKITGEGDKKEVKSIENLGNIIEADSLGASNYIEGKENNPFLIMGGKFFRKVCYNGDVTVEPCADFRQEVCIQSSIAGTPVYAGGKYFAGKDFKTAACRVNKWQDCALQNDSESCNNFIQRDCKWIDVPEKELKTEAADVPILGLSGNLLEGGLHSGGGALLKDIAGAGRCVPKYTPGLNFWGEEENEEENTAETTCAIGGGQCLVVKTQSYSQGKFHFLKIWQPVEQLLKGGEASGLETRYEGACTDKDGNINWNSNWKVAMNNVCQSIGDCEGKITGETELKEIGQEGGGGGSPAGGLLGTLG